MHDASITDMHNNLKCKSVEPCREQFSLIMLYNILKRNTNRTIRIHSRVLLPDITVPTVNYRHV